MKNLTKKQWILALIVTVITIAGMILIGFTFTYKSSGRVYTDVYFYQIKKNRASVRIQKYKISESSALADYDLNFIELNHDQVFYYFYEDKLQNASHSLHPNIVDAINYYLLWVGKSVQLTENDIYFAGALTKLKIQKYEQKFRNFEVDSGEIGCKMSLIGWDINLDFPFSAKLMKLNIIINSSV